VFLVNPPLIAIMLMLIGRLPASRPAGGQRIDVLGGLLVTVSIAALIFGLSNGQQHGFTAPVATGFAVLAGLLVAVLTHKRIRRTRPVRQDAHLAGAEAG